METRRINPGVEGIKPYVPGKSIAEVVRERGLRDVIKMASNENALGMSPRALAALQAHAAEAFQYPEVSSPDLLGALARLTGAPAEQIITGNGSDSVLYVLAMTLLRPGDEVIIPRITFQVYETVSRVMGARIVETRMDGYGIDLEDILRAVTPDTRLLWLCNPNNPTGTLVDESAFARLLERLPPQVFVVHDEVYHDFADRERMPRALQRVVAGAPNIFCVRSFSKAYGMAGLRLGYGVGPADLVATMHRVRPPFDVSVAAEKAGVAALGDRVFYDETLRMVSEGKGMLARELSAFGLKCVESHTNFVVVEVGGDDRAVVDGLIDAGVIVRPGAGYGLPGRIRVTVGRPEENRRFVAALRGVLSR
jgi:histidinol-phosphate aminotransferase